MKSLRQILGDYVPVPGAPMGGAEERHFDRSKFDAELRNFLEEAKRKRDYIAFALFILVLFMVLIVAVLVWEEKLLTTIKISKDILGVSILGLCIPVAGWIVRQFMTINCQRDHVRLIRIFAGHASDQTIQEMIGETLKTIPKIL